jgi:uncharacterized protein (TIGR00255 family)
MKSMTGYGRGRATFSGQQISVELSSVNRKQIEISVSLPRILTELEPRVRDEITSQISRGRVNVSVALHGIPKGNGTVHLNEPAAKAYLAELRQLAKRLKLEGEIRLQDVLRGPGVILEEVTNVDPETYWSPLHEALRIGLKSFQKMREKEGSHLSADLAKRLLFLRKETTRIEKLAPQVVERYRSNLLERVRQAKLEVGEQDERMLKEIVFFADRSDISEELTRLKSHFEQFDKALVKSEPVGRSLDFMIQEMNREVNTLGNKANDLSNRRAIKDRAGKNPGASPEHRVMRALNN